MTIESTCVDNLLLSNVCLYEVLITMHQQDGRFVVMQKKIYNEYQRFIKTLCNGYIVLEVLLDDFTY